MKDEILKGIERELGGLGLAELLSAGLQAADLHSLLLEVFRRRASERRPADLMADWRANRFVRPSASDPRALARFDVAAFWPREIPHVDVVFDQARASGRGYYTDVCFKIHARTGDGSWLEIGDGGAVDWTRQLLSNAKERLVISGLSSERVCALAGRQAPAAEG